MKIIDAKALIVGAKLRFKDNPEMLKALDMAIDALLKQIPTKPIMEEWNPARCPMCGAELSELIGDGYYKHCVDKEVCDCGQKLKWD